MLWCYPIYPCIDKRTRGQETEHSRIGKGIGKDIAYDPFIGRYLAVIAQYAYDIQGNTSRSLGKDSGIRSHTKRAASSPNTVNR